MSDNKKQALYTNSGVTFFDSMFTSMQTGFVDNNGFLKIASINSEFVNKKPKKGDKVYDYDNSIMYHISARDAENILTAISFLEESTDDVKRVEYTTGEEGELQRSFVIYKPNGIMLNKKRHNNYIIKLIKKDADNTSTVYHLFEKHSLNLVSVVDPTNPTAEEIEHHFAFELFKKFLKEVINNSFNITWHGAKRANNGFNGANKQRRSFSSNVVEEGDDENTSTTSSRKATQDLSNEFDD